MPNRILKEQITTSDTLPQVSMEAEVLFYRLMVKADDFGRYHAEPHLVLAQALSNRITQVTVEQVSSWLDELEAAGLIRRYQAHGRPYLELVTFSEHQPRRAAASKFPAPPEAETTPEQVKSSASNCNQVQSDEGKDIQPPSDDSGCKQPPAGESDCPQTQSSESKCEQPQASAIICLQVQSSESNCEQMRPYSNSNSYSYSNTNSSTRARDVSKDPAVSEAFARFMAVYPKGNERTRAWEAWCAAIAGGADPDELIAAAQHYAETVKRQGTAERYIKLAATFIDQESWRDYVQEPGQVHDRRVQPPSRSQTGRDSPVTLSGSGPYVPGVEETRRRLEALRAQFRGEVDGAAAKAAGAGE